MSVRLLVAVIALFGLVSNAHAVIIGGQVTSGSGAFVKLTVPFVAPFPPSGGNLSSVGDNNFQSLNLFGFDEDQNILLTDTLQVDVGSDVAANQVVASHYVFFDPGPSTRVQGFVDFDATIIGVATSKDFLDASDSLQNDLVDYLSPSLRGLESTDSVSIGGTNNTRLFVNFFASNPGDYVRVFTQFSPLAAVPVPATLPLLLTALAGFALLRRFRKMA